MAPLASPSTARGNSTACLRPALSNALILAATSSAVPAALRVKTISSLTARIAPNQTLRPPVSWAPAHYRLCRCNHKAGAWKMHANLADLTRAEGCLLGPPGKRVGCAVAGGIKARSGVPALEFAHDQLAVAIDVRANLQNRRLAIASRQRRQIRFRHDDGKLDRCPGKALEAKPGPNFLRIGRSVVMV